jgi:hypothetical protein
MKKHEDKLSKAIARLKQEGQAAEVPPAVVEETLRKIAQRGVEPRTAVRGHDAGEAALRRLSIRPLVRWAVAAAVLILCGYATGRLAAPKPLDLDALREALAPSVAAALEPTLRQKVAEEIRRDYQLALATTYARVKEELTDQYREDLKRSAVQILAASNAATNELLTQLAQAVDTTQTQHLRGIAQAMSEIERNQVQDSTRLASGLQTLAYREDELSRTQREIAQLLVGAHPGTFDVPPTEPRSIHQERN